MCLWGGRVFVGVGVFVQTMIGNMKTVSLTLEHTSYHSGIIPRLVDAVFEVGRTKANAKTDFIFKVSYVEIYMEMIR